MPIDQIRIKGAREHNLKNIDLELPRNKLIVITGVSGSGKSTLAFDTIYAEGQRRYVESLSAYARQFLELMDKPDVDFIEGLSPAIAIEQRRASQNPRSTVATATEIYDYLRLLFARLGTPYCYQCGRPIASQSIPQMVDHLMSLPAGSRITIFAPAIANRKGEHHKLLQRLRQEGYTRIRVDGDLVDLDAPLSLDKNKRHTIDVVIDRLIIKEGLEPRLSDSLELAGGLSDGVVRVDVMGGSELLFSQRFACEACGLSYPELTPQMFSFNSPQGACAECSGLGTQLVIDPELIVPDPELSIREGAILPWANRNSVHQRHILEALEEHYHFSIRTPFQELPPKVQQVLLYGSGAERINFFFERNGRRIFEPRPFEGVVNNLQRRYRETDTALIREEIERFMTVQPCPACGGARLRKEALAVRINGVNIHEITGYTVGQAKSWFDQLQLSWQQMAIGRRILKEITERLGFLLDVGLDYLTLNRSTASLSGGEAQRIRLATQIGSKLMGVLYILDEPSIGLHQRDNLRLLQTLKTLRDLGNTVIVVEHDADTIRSADFVVDMGPGAGNQGGKVVFSGSPYRLSQDQQSLTGLYLSGARAIGVPGQRRTPKGYLELEGARGHNLKELTVAIPLGVLTCVTGVSGSGKSTLIMDTLYSALCQKFYRAKRRPQAYARLNGLEQIDKVIHIDQSPIGRTPRSNPATYTGLFTIIRDLFAQVPEARARGYKPGRFSFNVRGGRCEACNGDGVIKIEMHFLPDVYVTCEVCQGRRFNPSTLEIRYKGKNIAEVLQMTVDQAAAFFQAVPGLRAKLATLTEVGLGYIQLGQPATTLSGGEAQRIKLSRELSRRATGRTLYILDEPTTGLHFADIEKLLLVLNHLVEAGNSVIVIEHNLEVIKTADYLIDLGPEGGDAGGQVVAQGTPEEVAQIPGSYTGQFLRPLLDQTTSMVR
ncbi:MAG: excinuclease ABC subunit UvrA [Deltaproteobacteria bacterium]|nr:MAG: excinuclease ABC subunit UvrA [Deltaproteobacteria bacterium]